MVLASQAVQTSAGDVSFTGAEVAMVGVVLSAVTAAIGILFKSLMVAKDEKAASLELLAKDLFTELEKERERARVDVAAARLETERARKLEEEFRNKLFETLTTASIAVSAVEKQESSSVQRSL